MAGSDFFEAIPEYLKEIGKNIVQETHGLAQQTDSLLGQIDDTCQKLPIYSDLESGFISWKALLERSDLERSRIGTTLQRVGEYIEQHEREITAKFTTTHQQGQACQ